MNKLQVVKLGLSKMAGRSGLLAQKYSPEILIGAGIVGLVASTVMACRATVKAEEILDKTHEQLDMVKFAKEAMPQEEYTEQDYRKDLVVVYAQTGLAFAKLYLPAIALGAASIGCILGAHGILKKRNVALMAAYKVMQESYDNYRQRVVDEFGADKDRQYRCGIHEEEVIVTEEDENGKKKKVKKTIEVADTDGVNCSPYARFFDETNDNWSKSPGQNALFVKCQQNWANDLLNGRGHIFLNEVYDALGLPRSAEGQMVGWIKNGDGDGFVDFGIYDLDNARSRDFVNGYERNVLLDFNVDGVIYNLI